MVSAPALTVIIACHLAALLQPAFSTSNTRSNNPFMFVIRNAKLNPVTYVHTAVVGQLTALPCYHRSDGRHFAVSYKPDMAWYRNRESMLSPRAFPSMSDSSGRLLILEPIIGYQWFLCDTAYTSKLNHSKMYDRFYSDFRMGRLDLDWNFYQDFSEFEKGQFKHHVFFNELSVTEIFIFMNATLRQLSDSTVSMQELTDPLQMGKFKLSLLNILETECRENAEQYCENPTIEILVPGFDSDGGVTIQGRMRMHLSNEKLLKLGVERFVPSRKAAIVQNLLRWNISSQSIDLGALAGLNPYPLSLLLIVTTQAQVKSDCVGSGSYLSVKNDWECVLCRPGTYLMNEPWIHPASEKNSICHMCPVGTYSNGWGSIECQQCPAAHTTRKHGSKKRADCLPIAKFELENAIKEMLSYVGVDESADYKKTALLAGILMAPWSLFFAFMLISMAYGHNEVRDSENRFQLEKELGLIILRIRRNYNILLDESLRL